MFILFEKMNLLYSLALIEFSKYKNISPRKVKDIIDLKNYVRLKILKNVYKSRYVI